MRLYFRFRRFWEGLWPWQFPLDFFSSVRVEEWRFNSQKRVTSSALTERLFSSIAILIVVLVVSPLEGAMINLAGSKTSDRFSDRVRGYLPEVGAKTMRFHELPVRLDRMLLLHLPEIEQENVRFEEEDKSESVALAGESSNKRDLETEIQEEREVVDPMIEETESEGPKEEDSLDNQEFVDPIPQMEYSGNAEFLDPDDFLIYFESEAVDRPYSKSY